jgi:diketogulonate reductase-like aldo/keto reductase
VTSILVGANKMAQLDDNLGAVNLELSAEELRELNELTAPAALYPNWFSTRVADVPVKDALAGC